MVKKFALYAAIVIGVALTIQYVSAQSPDVAPYVIGNAGGVTLYKQVYQGCELFIAVGTPGSAWQQNPAIATGRGCK